MDLTAKKSLGQHFLTSKHVLEQIIAASNIKKDELILEIGPGTGILTRRLLESGAKVLAIEKDSRAIELLKQEFANECQSGQLSIIEGDILDDSTVNLTSGDYAIVANIPYYITGAILEKFLEHEPRPNRMILLVQKEVADRITAKNSPSGAELGENGKESILSISVKAFGTPNMVARVSKGAFSPPPTVDSAILSIENISDIHFKENNVKIPRFFHILKAGFAHKRKYALNNILEKFNNEEDRSAIRKMWIDLQLDIKIRAEKISISDWFRITERISVIVPN
ncbi:MAG: 16S rRNA (adenine(1518)-N(6)/adenine(1519)-N(6))-dimethyltransferase RsmA [Candidatus Taylorbacteria bacterium]